MPPRRPPWSTPTPGTPAWPGSWPSLLYDVPHVLTAHSLEPLRPWKAEQLGGGYRISSWVEQTAVTAADAVIAVSSGMRDDVLRVYPTLDPSRVHVVRNGIDTEVWHPVDPSASSPGESVLADLGVDRGRPMVAFVGRITRQKGVAHLLAAAHRFGPDVQLVLCAGAPDTPEIAAEVSRRGGRAGPHAHRRVLGQGAAADWEDT